LVFSSVFYTQHIFLLKISFSKHLSKENNTNNLFLTNSKIFINKLYTIPIFLSSHFSLLKVELFPATMGKTRITKTSKHVLLKERQDVES